MHKILKLLRVKHYIKNAIVFVPLIFSLNIFNPNKAFLAAFAAIAFCLASSAVYIFNDLVDKEEDKLSPQKQSRPVTSGQISVKNASLIAFVLLILSLIISLKINLLTTSMILSYAVLNIYYTLKLRQIPLVDVSCIALGFILRILAGCFAINVVPSALVILLTFFTSMLFTFSKRRLEFALQTETRKTLKSYTEPMLNTFVAINATLSIAFYFTYMLDPSTILKANAPFLYITTIPFTLIILRLLMLVFKEHNTSDPTEIIFADGTVKALSIIYIAVLAIVLTVKF